MQSFITYILYALTALVPLTFTLTNSELFEFPKFILLLSGAILISAAWITNLLANKQRPQFQIKTWSLLDWGVLTVLATQTLATLTSIHPYTSFWGYYSRFHQGLLTTICYTIIYFAASRYLDNKSTQKLLKISVTTAFFIGLYAIAERLGIDKNLWVQDVQNRVFSTLGQPNWLAAYIVPHLFLALYFAQTRPQRSTMYYLLFALYFTTLLFTRSRSGFIAFALAYVLYFALQIRQFSWPKIKIWFIPATSYLILAMLIFGTPFTPTLSSYILSPKSSTPAPVAQGTQLETGGTESGDIRKIVWTGALDLIKKYPLLGTGPETFAYTYYWTRPIAHNLTSEWDFLYNKAHNEYLNIAATTGLIGLAGYLFFHVAIFLLALKRLPKTKKVNESELDQLRAYYPVLGATIVSFTVTNFFGFSVIPVYLLTILLSAVSSSLNRSHTQTPLQLNYSLASSIFLLFPILLLYPLHLFVADLAYARGKGYLDAGRPGEAILPLSRAVSARPAEALFTSALGEAYSQLGKVDKAVSLAERSRQLNPHHLNYYKSRAKIYLTLASTDPQYNEQGEQELTKARELAPTDPKLAYNLGLVSTRLALTEQAEHNLRDAIALKPNYGDPYYALTLLYEQTRNPAPIPELLTQARANLATYSAQLKEKMDKYLP